MRKSENPNNFLKVIVALLLIIVTMAVGYNMFFKRNEEILDTDFNVSDVQKNVTTNNVKEWNLILVNRWNKIPENYNVDLVEVLRSEERRVGKEC